MNAIRILLFLASTLLLTNCNEPPKKDIEIPETKSDTVAENNHHHGNANEYMNQSEFEELINRFENKEREKWQQPDKVISFLGDIKNKTVVDIGAGTAYFETRMKDATAKLIAADADERFVKYIDERIVKEKLTNVSTRKAEYEKPPFQSSEADIVFMVNVYHHIENRVDYFKLVKSGLKQNGNLIIVDFKKGDFEVGPPDEMKLNANEVIDEIKNAGLTLVTADSTTLKYQYMLKFK